VTNAGSNGKFVGVMDLDFDHSKKNGKPNLHYSMKPIFSNWLKADSEMEAYLSQMRSKRYDDSVVEARNENYKINKSRLGKSYDEILTEKLAIADRTLYRRGNFMGTWDQVLCNALRYEYRISDARLDNGEKIDPNKSYKLAGWATVNRTPEGRLMWDVTRDYILQNKQADNVLNANLHYSGNNYQYKKYTKATGVAALLTGIKITENTAGQISGLEVIPKSYLGNEKITTSMGSYNSIKVKVIRNDNKRETIFWLAKEFDFLPVKLMHTEKGEVITTTIKNYQKLK